MHKDSWIECFASQADGRSGYRFGTLQAALEEITRLTLPSTLDLIEQQTHQNVKRQLALAREGLWSSAELRNDLLIAEVVEQRRDLKLKTG